MQENPDISIYQIRASHYQLSNSTEEWLLMLKVPPEYLQRYIKAG